MNQHNGASRTERIAESVTATLQTVGSGDNEERIASPRAWRIVAASIGSPVSSIIAALLGPMLCARRADWPLPPIQPSLISGAANVAVVDA